MSEPRLDGRQAAARGGGYRISIRLFGPLDVRIQGEALPALRSRKGHWLLALLALRGGASIDREQLAALIWPESGAPQALAGLRRTLTDLRAALGTAAANLEAPSPGALRLATAGAWVDVLEFDRLLQGGAEADLRAAVALHRGALLEGCAEEWVFPERQLREERYLDALDRLGREALLQGRPGDAVRWLRAAAATDPLREDTQRSLMQALVAEGSYPAALQVYRELRTLLLDELGARPEPATAALFEQLRTEASRRPAAVRPAAPTVRLPGVRAGFPEPGAPDDEPGVKPEAPVLADSAPPQPSLGIWRSQLTPPPQPLTAFVGRGAEVPRVVEELRAGRLVTLTGPAGVGKTRLAVEAARRFAELGPNPGEPALVAYVDLSALSSEVLVAPAAAAALGMRAEPGAPLPLSLCGHLAQRELLLLLDNCEHVLDAAARLTRAMLEHCPGLRVLATSRQALGLVGEAVRPVDPLSLPPLPAPGRPASDAPEQLLQSEAVRLFVERAAAARPGFRLTHGNGAAIRRICWRLDGIPLAIELAAARTRLLSPDQIAARLDDRFRVLAEGSHTALPRHQTLRATLDWSYETLTAEERVLFRRLCVFAGQFTLEAAEAICGGTSEGNEGAVVEAREHDVLEPLALLVERSLVRRETLDPDAEEPRYRLLETTREYGRRLLEAGNEASRIRQRHAEYYLELAEEAAASLDGPDAARWLQRLDAAHDDLRAALAWWAWSAGTPGAADRALRLAVALAGYWLARCHLTEGRRWLATVLELEGADARHRISALAHGTALAREQGDLDEAAAMLEEARLAMAAREEAGLVPALLAEEGALAETQGELAKARGLYERALALMRSGGHLRGVAGLLGRLGAIAAGEGDPVAAAATLRQSLALQRQLRNSVGVAWSVASLALVSLAAADRAAAAAGLRRALELFEEHDCLRGVLVCLDGLSLVVADTANLPGEWREAAQLQGATIALRESAGIRLAPVAEARAAVMQARVDAALGIHAAEARAAGMASSRSVAVERALHSARRLQGPQSEE